MKTGDTEINRHSVQSRPINEGAIGKLDVAHSIMMSRGITMRSFIIGIILAVFHTAWLLHQEICTTQIAGTGGMLLGSVLVLIILLLMVNSVLKRTIPSWMFSPTEIMVIFILVSTATFMAGNDILQLLFPVLLWPFYYDSAATGYSKFLQYIPKYFVPQDKEIIRQFYVGGHDYWYFFRPEILKAWLVPMLFWGGFIFLLAFTMLCLGSILRRQWLDREKLSFPVIDLPMDLAKGITIGSILRNRLFMTAFLVVTAVYSLNGLSILFPSVPSLSLNVTDVGNLFLKDAPFKGMNPIYLAWGAGTIGLCYLIPLDILFSSWFFFVLIRLSCIPATSLGWRDPDVGMISGNAGDWPYYNNISEGAMMGMAFMVLWNARKHLIDVVRTAFSKEKIPGDDREPMPYRAAFFGAVGGFVLLVGIVIISGVRPHIALLFFTIYFLAIIVMAKLFSQLVLPGLFFYSFHTSSLVSNLVGLNGLNHSDHTVLASFFWFNRSYGQHPMGYGLEAMAIADRQKQSMRRLYVMMLVAIAVGIAVGIVTILRIYYDRGGASGNVLTWPVTEAPQENWFGLQAAITDPKPFQFMTVIRIAASAGIVLLLGIARNMWIGFPLNPVGYVLATGYTLEYMWNIVLVVWLVKVLIIRYGGLQAYRKTLPFFYGLIISEAVCFLVWGLVLNYLGIKTTTVLGPVRM